MPDIGELGFAKLVITARNSGLVLTKLSANFTTTGTTFVDVTGMSVSVPDKYFVAARCDLQKVTAGNGNLRLVHGATPDVDQTINQLVAGRITKATKIFQNIAGSAVTYKLQANSSDANTFTVYQLGATPAVVNNAGGILVSGPFAIQNTALGNFTLVPVEADVTSVNFIQLGSVRVAAMGGEKEPYEYDLTTITLNNIIYGLYYSVVSTISYAEGANNGVPSTGFSLFCDWAGDNLQYTP